MLDRTFAKDEAFNRRFIVGVTSTGIYCVPACRAPKPKPENIQFFGTPDEAAKAGLRACKRCYPNQAFAGIDPDEILFEELVGHVREKPQEFDGVEAMARTAGVSASRLHSGLRTYYHSTPLELLTDARVALACRRLHESDAPVANVGTDVGFASTSVFYENFARLVGMPPAAYRALSDGVEFSISGPQPYPRQRLMDYLGRDKDDPILRRCGTSFRMALGGDSFSLAEIEVGDSEVRVRVEGRGDAVSAHGALRKMMGLNQDARPLDTLLNSDPRFALLAREAGLRVFQTPTVFDAIVWSILGQQMTVRFAMVLRQRLYEFLGTPNIDGIHAPLQPLDVIGVNPSDLLPLQFSLRKAEYVVGVAKRFVSEGLDPEELLTWPATRVQRWLKETRGFGPWSTNYVMMRGCGLANCVPYGDTGLMSGLVRLYGLDARPTKEETNSLMKPFEPYRSLATFRIWFAQKYFDAETVVA